MSKLILYLVLHVAVTVYTVLRIRKSGLDSGSKMLLYVFAVLTPVVGLILFLIMNRRQSRRRLFHT